MATTSMKFKSAFLHSQCALSFWLQLLSIQRNKIFEDIYINFKKTELSEILELPHM